MKKPSKAQIFFKEYVLPSHHDWLNDELVEYKAMALATNVCHLADYYWESHSSQPTKVFSQNHISGFKHQLTLHSVDYALIRDVCNAHKHCKLTNKSKKVSNSNQTGINSMGWNEGKWNDAEWDKEAEIVILDDNNEKHHFKAIVARAILFWQNLL